MEGILTPRVLLQARAVPGGEDEPAAGDGWRLRRLFAGGEALPAALAQRARERWGAEVINLYGPTEACIDSTFHAGTDAAPSGSVPIGRAVDNLRACVLDAAMRPAR